MALDLASEYPASGKFIPRLMCITAHPDDECGGFAGALMMAAARGAGTSVVCLTEGRAASNRGAARNGDELASLRRAEFAAGLRLMGVGHGEILNYPDGALVRHSFSEVAAALTERIRRFRPHVVLTFGGDGGINQHPDHAMACFFATAAFHWAGRPSFAPEQIAAGLAPYAPQKLYYSSPGFFFHAQGEQDRIASVPCSLTLQLGELKARKLAAFREHKTQAPLLARVEANFEKDTGEERYLLAAGRGTPSLECGGAPQSIAVMFEGLDDTPSDGGNHPPPDGAHRRPENPRS